MSTSSKPRPIFIAALPREVASLVARRGWRADTKLLSRGIHLFEHEHAIVACAGMGTNRASLAVEAALSLSPASQLISVGWAGACSNHYHVGEIIRPNVVVDVKTGERYFTEEPSEGKRGQEVIVTVAQPASVQQKKRLGVDYYAAAVDMEAAAVGRLARANELPFYAIKAVSDEAAFELPDLARFVTPQGAMREAALGLHIALHPPLWKPMLVLAKNSKLAAARICLAIEAHIQNGDRHS